MNGEFDQYVEKDVKNGTMRPGDKFREIARIIQGRLIEQYKLTEVNKDTMDVVIKCCECVAQAKGKMAEAILWAHWQIDREGLGIHDTITLEQRFNEIINELCAQLNRLVAS